MHKILLPALLGGFVFAAEVPRINGPTIYGARPGHPFIYRTPCTGTRPIQFTVSKLPYGLTFDVKTGIIGGRAPEKPGTYELTLTAKNASGQARKRFRIVVGDTLALTPPMGWNDWYTHYHRITDKLMREAADAMIASGMADYGYQFVNIDDCWMTKPGSEARDSQGAIKSNENFPDMKALTAYIHGKGLKAGIYTSPGPTTCARYTGSDGHVEQDFRKFAEWGFDFLKYDWCSYGRTYPEKTLANYMKPYEIAGDILRKLDRDIVFNLCQYGMGDVWKWGGKVNGNCWRTTGDLGLAKDTSLPGFYSIGFKNAEQFEYARPGQWNDPDYILIGKVGNARDQSAPPKSTGLTKNEQYSYMSMWSLMASPLFFSGDMNTLDAFTLSVLCNAEVIDVNQDALGKQARIVRKTDQEFVLEKPLEDGSVAIGLFNLTNDAKQMKAGAKGKVRDLWQHKELGRAAGEFTATVAPHGVVMVRVAR